jgi:hypothetical protein
VQGVNALAEETAGPGDAEFCPRTNAFRQRYVAGEKATKCSPILSQRSKKTVWQRFSPHTHPLVQRPRAQNQAEHDPGADHGHPDAHRQRVRRQDRRIQRRRFRFRGDQ